jgi:hypothetical protein
MTIGQLVDALLRLAILAVVGGVVRAGKDDGALLVTRRPLLDPPVAGLRRIGEEEVEVERAHVRVVRNDGLLLGRALVDLDGAVVARRGAECGAGDGQHRHQQRSESEDDDEWSRRHASPEM